MFCKFRSGVSAALAVVLVTAMVAKGAPEPQTTPASGVDILLPADSESVVSFNIKQVLSSEIVKKFALEQIKQALQGNDAQKMIEEIGLDPLKDIDRVIVGASGSDANDVKALVVIHGKFSPDKLFKAAEAQAKKDPDKFTMMKDGKDVVFKFQPDNGNPWYATVVDETTVIAASDKKMIATALKAAAAGSLPEMNKALAALIRKMDNSSTMWSCSVVKGKLDKFKVPAAPGVPQNLQELLPKLETATMVIKVSADVNLDIGLGMKDEDTAKSMGEVTEELLTTVKGFAPLLAANDPKLKPLGDVAKSLKSSVKGSTVTISAKMTGDAIGKMINMND